ncbi:hypothetical protein HIM_05482 [Hirsutella minnesotensis 3608]|uniref:Uncharacterized protein n=1 Tax=Hirsutella minnesotensis 3608 TaxID=1043627 RepID=A0A0F7ZK59_9HYPO|nr:hypothetical protein HIM_05482 [Hirsutella minnesotensis 3608]
MMEASVRLNISDDGDSEADKEVIGALDALVNGFISPDKAAVYIDTTIAKDCQEAHVSYTSPSRPSLTSGGEVNRTPSTSGWLKFLWDCIAKSSMAIPFDHSGQDRLAALLLELQRLPRHDVPELYQGLEQWLWEIDQGHFTGTRQVETSSSAATAYMNFSAFIARLFANGIVETSRLCALIRPSPFALSKPLASTRYSDPAEAAQHYEPYASAAAQWILFAGEDLFIMCQQNVILQVGKQKWTRALWDSWKAKFLIIAKAEQFSSQARGFATRALERIAETERSKASSTSVVEKFGFMSATE